MSMGALISTVQKWKNFQEALPRFLGRYGVFSLHMTDFVSNNGQFKGDNWKNSGRRKRFIERAIAFVKDHTKCGFTNTIPLVDFKTINAIYEVEEFMGSPLVICGMGIISRVSYWVSRRGFDPKEVVYFIEDGDEDKGRFITKARSYGFEVQPLSKARCCIFQVCDMAAWKYSVGMRNAENRRGSFEEIERSLNQMSPIMHDNVALDRGKLELKCIEKGVPRRK